MTFGVHQRLEALDTINVSINVSSSIILISISCPDVFLSRVGAVTSVLSCACIFFVLY